MALLPASLRGVLFDLDGTLVDTAPDLINATNALRVEHGLTPLPTSRVRAVVSMGGKALTRLALGEPANDAELERLLSLYADCLGESSHLFEGLSTLIEQLDQSAISWGIVTNKERRFAEPLLARLALTPGVLVCGDDIAHAKPSPDGLLMAASALEVSVAECVYVGDHQRDISAAHNAGMAAIAAGFGYLSPNENAADWGAELSVASPEDLVEEIVAIIS